MTVTIRRIAARSTRHATEDDGQGLVEYGLILTLVAVASVAALQSLVGPLGDAIQSPLGVF
jgi:Flp pilus assembly pilin Flp